jgi:preprotein translocase subunit SecE
MADNKTVAPQAHKSNYIKDVIGELRKTTWPSREEGFRLTGIVLVVIFVFTSFIFCMDLILTGIWKVLLPGR